MAILNDLATLLLLVLTVVAGLAALFTYNKHNIAAARTKELEKDLRSSRDDAATQAAEIEQLRTTVEKLNKLASAAGIDTSPAPEPRPASSKSDKRNAANAILRDPRRLKEMKTQLDDVRNQLDATRRSLKVREQDVQTLRVEVDELHVALAHAKTPRVLDATEKKPAGVETKAVSEAPQPPCADAAAVAEQIDEERKEELTQQVEAAEEQLREAQGRANLAELKLRQTNERLSEMDKRAHELLDRLVKAESGQQSLQRQLDGYKKIYLGLKGRFEVARDTLSTFRNKFGVTIPTEVGVSLHGDTADYVEYEEVPFSDRPKADMAHHQKSSRSGQKRKGGRPTPLEPSISSGSEPEREAPVEKESKADIVDAPSPGVKEGSERHLDKGNEASVEAAGSNEAPEDRASHPESQNDTDPEATSDQSSAKSGTRAS